MTTANEKQQAYIYERPDPAVVKALREERKRKKEEARKQKMVKIGLAPDFLEKAAKGQFEFDTFNGFTLVEAEYRVPSKEERKQKRDAFDAVRKEFLKYIGEHCVSQLRRLGMTNEQLDQIQKGQAPNGFNVHHKLPLQGGGTNSFSNLIFIPIKPHDELHNCIIKPQIGEIEAGESKKIRLPWSDQMVYEPPANDRSLNRGKPKMNKTVEMVQMQRMTASRR